MRTILVALFVRCHVLAERLFALLAHKRHLGRSCKLVGLRLSMALGTVKPLLATWCADGDLGVQNVLALWTQVSLHAYEGLWRSHHIIRAHRCRSVCTSRVVSHVRG